jgi:hypothetical protein
MIYTKEIEDKILEEYGISIKLDKYEIMLKNFKEMIKSKIYNYEIDRFGRIISTKTRKKYSLIKHIGDGSFNKASIFREDPSGIEYVVKISKTGIYEFNSNIYSSEEEFKNLFDGFYENIKHVVLYIIIKKYLNFKLIAKPFYFGILKNMEFDGPTIKSTSYIPIMIMEKGEFTLENYIEKLYQSETLEHDNNLICVPDEKYRIMSPSQLQTYKTNSKRLDDERIKQINKILIRIYNYLITINKTLGIEFKHNDLKLNNIVMINETDNSSMFDISGSMYIPYDTRIYDNAIPLIIDFGFCEFKINQNYLLSGLSPRQINFIHNQDYILSPSLPRCWNSILDIMMLHSSLNIIQICMAYGLDVNHTNTTKSQFGPFASRRFIDEFKNVKYDLIDFPSNNLLIFKHNQDSNILGLIPFFYMELWNIYNTIFTKGSIIIDNKEIKKDPNHDGNETKVTKNNLWRIFYYREIFTENLIKNLIEKIKEDLRTNKPITFYIEPLELAHNIGLTHFNLKEIKYKNKYLKYKMKYLALKNSRL